jgi:uncharacterized iron-regulated membrane protein
MRSLPLRPLLVLLHRWFGLGMAVFLFIAGSTGALISWDHELDAAINPHLFHARSGAAAQLPGTRLAAMVEAADPRLRVTYVMTAALPGHTSQMMVEGRIDPATGQPWQLGFNQLAVDPATGRIQGRRMWGEVSLTRENLLPFLYKLHYTMHLPDGFGIELGVWLMGIVGMVWVLDCFIALWLSFPNWRSWRKSFAVRWSAGGHKLTFDLHRSGGVWIWLLLLVVAITSVSMNLNNQVVRPLVASLSTLAPDAFASRMPAPPGQPIEPVLSRDQAIRAAQAEAARHGLDKPAGGVFYASAFGLYGVGFFDPGNDHGDVGLGNAWLYLDGRTGQAAGARIPGKGSAGDIFLQAQFPLHSGRIIGIPGRILMSFLGLMVAMLSVTGVVIWVRKRSARRQAVSAQSYPAAGGAPMAPTRERFG